MAGLAPATTGSRGPSHLIRVNATRLSGGGGQIVTTATKVVLKPLEDRIVVRTLEAEQTTASGLVIPDTAKEKPQEGEVLAVGPGRFDDAGAKRVPMDVKVGDVVLYSKYGGTEVKYHGEEYLVLSARDAAVAPGRWHDRPGGCRTQVCSDVIRGTHGQDDRVRRGGTARAGARRRPARRRGKGDAGAARPQRRHRQEVGRSHDHERWGHRRP